MISNTKQKEMKGQGGKTYYEEGLKEYGHG